MLEPCGWAATRVLMAAHVRSTGGRGSSGGPCPSPRSQLPPGSGGQFRPLCISVSSIKSQNKKKKLLIMPPDAREACALLSDGPSKDPRRQELRRNPGHPGGCRLPGTMSFCGRSSFAGNGPHGPHSWEVLVGSTLAPSGVGDPIQKQDGCGRWEASAPSSAGTALPRAAAPEGTPCVLPLKVSWGVGGSLVLGRGAGGRWGRPKGRKRPGRW